MRIGIKKIYNNTAPHAETWKLHSLTKHSWIFPLTKIKILLTASINWRR